MKQVIYTYNHIMYYTWDSVRKNFPKVVFPDEENLTIELLNMFNIKRDIVEVPDTSEYINQRENNVRLLRNKMLNESDKYMLSDFPIEQIKLDSIKSWRQYLRDYTKLENWYKDDPKPLEDWLNNNSENLYE